MNVHSIRALKSVSFAVRATPAVQTVPVRFAFWDRISSTKSGDATTSDNVIEKTIIDKKNRPHSPVEVVDGVRFKYAVGGKFTQGPNGVKVQVWTAPKTSTIKSGTAPVHIDKTSYRAVNRMRKKTLSSLPDWNSEEFSASAHEIAANAANQTIEIKVAEPVFRQPGRLGGSPIKTLGEKLRTKKIEEESVVAIADARKVYEEFVTVPETKQTYTSSPSEPLTFGNNNWLKFQVISAIVESAGFAVPSSRLAAMNNVNDVIADIISNRANYVERLNLKAVRGFPKNVTIVRETKRVATKLPVGLRHKLNQE